MKKKNYFYDSRLAGSMGISGVCVCVRARAGATSVCSCARAGASRQANTMQHELVLSSINVTYKHKPRQYYGMHSTHTFTSINIKIGVACGLLHLLARALGSLGLASIQ